MSFIQSILSAYSFANTPGLIVWVCSGILHVEMVSKLIQKERKEAPNTTINYKCEGKASLYEQSVGRPQHEIQQEREAAGILCTSRTTVFLTYINIKKLEYFLIQMATCADSCGLKALPEYKQTLGPLITTGKKEILAVSSGTYQPHSRCTYSINFKILCPFIPDFTKFSENLTSDLTAEICEIITFPRFLVDAHMVSVWNSYISSFSSYRIHKLGCPCLPAWLPAHQAGWQQYPVSLFMADAVALFKLLKLRSGFLNQSDLKK